MIELWNTVLLEPTLNGLILFSQAFGGSYGMAIIVLTIIINLIILPLRMKQLKSTKAFQSLQPKMQELQKKYGKDKQKLSQETMKLYREAGVNPLGCAFPLIIQFPIWIALYESIITSLIATPERLLNLSQHLYSVPVIQQAVPPQSHFLWMNLAVADPFLALLVIGSMWVTQKMSTMSSPDPKQQQMSQMMLWIMPLFFGLICLFLPAGLALYILIMNLIGIVTQYFVMGWGGLASASRKPVPAESSASKDKTSRGGKKTWKQ